ncbi:MAG: hypothetical protein E6Q24_01035 [Chitinophagaceae bacterium]|nr:MAG: hypothetical protein E6Q24_01035 [Chitinophagaceae bacterium]
MRTYLLILCGIVLLSACTANRVTNASRIGLVPLSNYFVKNTVALPDEYNYKVSVNQPDFDQTFGVAATMNSSITKPDFSGQMVVAVMGKASSQQQEISFDRATIGGKDLNVYYNVKKGSEQSYTSTALALATVPKSGSVKRANFYRDSVLVKTIPIGFQ